jgi:NAD(P)-dependent dehydrogenase (short-subunit alcohol dehydrogenase family)
VVPALLIVLLALAGCSADTDRRIVEGAAEVSTDRAFYTLPDPVPPGAPGSIVLTEPLHNATKGAVNALVQSMALDLGRDGVRVNAIAPAFTATRQTQERLDDPVFRSALHDRLALDRAADPEDVARAALFLASPDAAYITGVVLPVDGGTTASVGTPRPIAG